MPEKSLRFCLCCSIRRKATKKYSLESQFPLNELFELVRPSTCGFDDFGFRVDQMVFDEVQACFDVGIFKLDEVQTGSDLFLHGDFIELVTGSLLGWKQRINTQCNVC